MKGAEIAALAASALVVDKKRRRVTEAGNAGLDRLVMARILLIENGNAYSAQKSKSRAKTVRY